MNAPSLDSMLTYSIVFMIGMLAGILALTAVEHIRERRALARERAIAPTRVTTHGSTAMPSSVLPTVMQPR